MNFKLYSDYYDLLYFDKNYREETEYILNILKENSSIDVGNILELGGGSGLHAAHFCSKGNKLFGVELSETMIQLAKQKKIINYEIKQGNIVNQHYDDNFFDSAVSLFHVISYLNTNDEVISCFNNVNNQLKRGALFIFDVWYTPGVYSLKPETRVKRSENEHIKVIRIAESIIHSHSSVVDVNYTISIHEKSTKNHQEILETHKMRHFTQNEIELFAKFCGFEVVLCEEFLSKKPLSINSWGALFVLKKI
jgi:SAM-dependent methyltransferase